MGKGWWKGEKGGGGAGEGVSKMRKRQVGEGETVKRMEGARSRV